MDSLKIFQKNLDTTIINFNKLRDDKKFIKNLNLAIKQLTSSMKNNGKIIFAGNGGSAADAQHLSAELVGRYLEKRRAISAISLSTDTSVITSLANDFDICDANSNPLRPLLTLFVFPSGNVIVILLFICFTPNSSFVFILYFYAFFF